MDRTTRRFLILTVGLVTLAILASQSGCVNALATAAWLVKGNDVGADFNGLRNKPRGGRLSPVGGTAILDRHAVDAGNGRHGRRDDPAAGP